MQVLTPPTILIKENSDNYLKEFLSASLKYFYEELDSFCIRNSNTNFGQWFSESGYLSMYINGIFRNESKKRVSAIQEYCVSNAIGGNSGRCDGFIERDKMVFLVEAKRQKYSRQVDGDHFNLDKWLAWDKETIQVQLRRYLDSEEKFFLKENRYEEVYLMTIVFKVIKENATKHLANAAVGLSIDEISSDRMWYYSTSFLNSKINEIQDGIEVYGTIEKYLIE